MDSTPAPPNETLVADSETPSLVAIQRNLRLLRAYCLDIQRSDAETLREFSRAMAAVSAAASERSALIAQLRVGITECEQKLAAHRAERGSALLAMDLELKALQERARDLAESAAHSGELLNQVQHRIAASDSAADAGQSDAALPDSALAPASFMVEISGVTSAALALGLQEHLANLPGVSQVAATEFANGILKFSVDRTGHFSPAEFTSTLGDSLESLSIRGSRIELRLSGQRGGTPIR